MENEPYVIEKTLNAPIERVWKAITDKDRMKEWYFDLEEFKAEEGFKFEFSAGDENKSYLHVCEVTAVEPPNRLTYSWSYEGYKGKSYVTFELSPAGDKTRVKLIHEDLNTFPDDPAFARESFAAGWEQIIGKSLKDYVEMDYIRKSVEIGSSDDGVWEVLTNLDVIREWAKAFHEGTYVESDWNEGSEVIWKTPEEGSIVKGRVEVNFPPRILTIDYFDNADSNPEEDLGEYKEHYTLTEHEGKTMLTLESGPLSLKHLKEHEVMWDNALRLIKKLAEKG